MEVEDYLEKLFVVHATYTANSNIDIAITQGNYIFSVRSAGVYHYNGIFLVTYYDSADRSSSGGGSLTIKQQQMIQ